MISRSAINKHLQDGTIQIAPTPTPELIGPNSIDLHIGDEMHTLGGPPGSPLDPHDPPRLVAVPKDPDFNGWTLQPGVLYLSCTAELTYCAGLVPHLVGRSTAGRLGISIHQTAGLGDNGFRGRWTLEITVVRPVRIRPGDRLLQVAFSPCLNAEGQPAVAPEDLYSAQGHHYQGSAATLPPNPL